jgi:hypothetical protein
MIFFTTNTTHLGMKQHVYMGMKKHTYINNIPGYETTYLGMKQHTWE